jgi:hypothetical protein
MPEADDDCMLCKEFLAVCTETCIRACGVDGDDMTTRGAGTAGAAAAAAAPVLAPIERAFLALAATSNGSGQLLGQAISSRSSSVHNVLDQVRAWLAQGVVWGSLRGVDRVRGPSIDISDEDSPLLVGAEGSGSTDLSADLSADLDSAESQMGAGGSDGGRATAFPCLPLLASSLPSSKIPPRCPSLRDSLGALQDIFAQHPHLRQDRSLHYVSAFLQVVSKEHQ